MRTKTFFLDQGETLGGAERFLLDFFQKLTPAETRRILPVVIGAKSKKYRLLLPSKIEVQDFVFPSVRGRVLKKLVIISRLLKAAHSLKKLAQKEKTAVFFSNTPRTHFVMFLAKQFFRMDGRWIVMNHDFTVPAFLLRKIASCADILIANSIPCREYLRRIINKKDFKKVRIIENGIDFSAIPKQSPPLQIKKILMLGRIDPRKGQMFATQAAELLQSSHPDLQFFVVGSPFKEDTRTMKYRDDILKFVHEKNIQNIHFLGEVDNPFEAIIGADCLLVLPTEPETFGRIVTEGLALGKLIISFDETGPKDILKNYELFLKTKNSLRVEKQNPHALAKKIAFFADNPQEVQLFTKKAREFVEKNFSLDETKKRLVNVILED
ncbi:glycosyltransferase family 4 protein [Candidatus Gracilibacteria bacterium]|nr:glycosyltransferase family 4 protein [Candidatus Gracilibacteria bacterium]